MTTVAYAVKQELPVTHVADVVVVGGGPGGLGAAVLAARTGAKVLLVERFGLLGGMATVGEIHPFMYNHRHQKNAQGEPVVESLDHPVYLEWLAKMKTYFAPAGKRPPLSDPEAKEWRDLFISKELAALAAEDLCLEAGVRILYHHALADVILAGDRIDALVLFSKSGYTAVRGKTYVDCSGDADLAARAGCECEYGGPSGFCQPMTLCFKLCKVDRARMPKEEEISRIYNEAKARGEIDCPRENILTFDWLEGDVVHFNTTRVIQHNATNGAELSEAEIIARRQLRQLLALFRRAVPGFEQAEIYSMGTHIGVRESRRVKGLAYVTREDFVQRRKFPDAIARVNYPIDIHNPSGAGTELIHMTHEEWYEIPYGAVVAKDVRNLLVGGRPISVDHAIHSSMRVMPPACSVGQAAGVAAALSAARNVSPHQLDGAKVREKLRELGARL